MNAIDLLKKYWGHNKFRLNQEKIIQQVIAKNDTLALLPTGGGKSICYQIPTLMSEGICLVISPLISLMDDQVRFLKSKGIKSVSITSAMQYKEIDTALTNCIYGRTKFLYVSPERLQNELLIQRIKEMNINLITVDEAHCISEWGHNFRPAYRHISDLKKLIPDVPILALTATATTNVINDIQENLGFKKNNLIQSSFIRYNLSYIVDNVKDKNKRLLNLVEKIKSSAIVYVGSRKKAKEVTEFLLSNNFSANSYHAGMSSKERRVTQESWSKNETRIIVATNAFGMGIDKSDVKLVIHMDLPSTIESYFQQSGRAGRNGKQAYTFLLANKIDIKKQQKLLELRFPSIAEIKDLYQQLANFLQIAENTLPLEPIPFDISSFCKRYKTSYLSTYNMLKYLEKEEHILATEAVNTASKIKINISNAELYKFQISNHFYDSFIKILLRSYSNLFSNYSFINEEEIAIHYNSTIKEVKQILNRLDKLEILNYKTKNNSVQITYLKHRKDKDLLYLNEQKWIERKEYEKEKLRSIINYISNKKECRSKLLLEYFSEKDSPACEKCDFCVKQQREDLSMIEAQLKVLLKKNELSFDEINEQVSEKDKKKIVNCLESLFDRDKIIKFGNKYKWKEK